MEAAGIRPEARIPEYLAMSDSAERGLEQLRKAMESGDLDQINVAKVQLSDSVIAWAIETEVKSADQVAALATVRASGIFTNEEVRAMDKRISTGVQTKANVTGARSAVTSQIEEVSGGSH